MTQLLMPRTSFPPVSAAAAFAADAMRLGDRLPTGGVDDAWLSFALALSRLPLLPSRAGRTEVAEAIERAVAHCDALHRVDVISMLRVSDGLRAMRDVPPGHGHPAAESTVAATQAVAAEQEALGAYGIAYVTLDGLRRGLRENLSLRLEGMLLAQQGRAARQAGEYRHARDVYERALDCGETAQDPEVSTRALLGLGALASVRGNYGDAREILRRGLRTARRTRDAELMRAAHVGLQTAALTAGDLDTALVEGWHAFQHALAGDARSESLTNLAHVCLLAGEYRSAIHAARLAVQWSTSLRTRTAALGAWALGAARTRDVVDTELTIARLRVMIEQVPDAYLRCDALCDIAEAFHAIGSEAEARQVAEQAIAAATDGGFHQLAVRAQRFVSLETNTVVADTLSTTTDAPRKRSPRFVRVLTALDAIQLLAEHG